MPGWQTIYVNNCERGFTAQETDHLMVANYLTVHYVHQGERYFPRPELKPKDRDLGHSEIYQGRFAQSGFYISAQGRFGLVSPPIPTTPGLRTRASVMYMHVYGTPFALGSRCGLIDGDGPFTGGPVWSIEDDPFNSACIEWGSWRWARQNDVNLAPREWAKLSTPEIVASSNYVRMVAQFNADVAGPGSNGHWDAFSAEQYVDDPITPPPNGDYATVEQVQEMIDQRFRELGDWLADR